MTDLKERKWLLIWFCYYIGSGSFFLISRKNDNVTVAFSPINITGSSYECLVQVYGPLASLKTRVRRQHVIAVNMQNAFTREPENVCDNEYD